MMTALLLAACGSPDRSAFLSKPECEFDSPYWWYDSPTLSVATANGGERFDFDPPSAWVTNRTGSYNANGDLEWVDTYGRNRYLETRDVRGYGTVYSNGDLDVLLLSTSTDSWGDTLTNRQRVIRDGCATYTDIWAGVDPDDPIDATPDGSITEVLTEFVSNDAVEITQTYVDSEVSSETRQTVNRDLSSSSSWSTDGDGYETTATSATTPEGVTTTDFTQSSSGGADFEGTWTEEVDGSTHWDYDVIENGTVVVSWDFVETYAGFSGTHPYTAEGTYAFLAKDGNLYTCDYYEDRDTCRLTCDLGDGVTDYDC